MNTIGCECQFHEGHPVACCGDFVCVNPLPNFDSSGDQERVEPLSPPGTAAEVGKPSRVNAMRRLFEDKIHVMGNARAFRENSSKDDTMEMLVVSKGDRCRAVIEAEILQPITPDPKQENPRCYRSHTKIAHIPNGVKITTTILTGDNLEEAEPSAYETLVFPESEIIKRFERDFDQIVRSK